MPARTCAGSYSYAGVPTIVYEILTNIERPIHGACSAITKIQIDTIRKPHLWFTMGSRTGRQVNCSGTGSGLSLGRNLSERILDFARLRCGHIIAVDGASFVYALNRLVIDLRNTYEM